MTRWTQATFSEIAISTKGKKPPALVDDSGLGMPYLTADVLRGGDPTRWVPSADEDSCIVLTGAESVILWDGAGAGDVFRAQPGVVASTMAKVVPTNPDDLKPEFLMLLLENQQALIKASCRGTTVPHVSPEALASLQVQIPPIAEQRRIVDLISSVDSYIDALQRQADAAREARAAVLGEVLAAGGSDWTETTLGGVAEWFSGGTPKAGEPEYYQGGTIPWAVIADMATGEIHQTEKSITPEGLEQIGGRLAPVGSTLISMYATVGRAAYAHIPVATNQAIAWSVPDERKINPRFLFLIAQSLEKSIASMARGATQRNVNRGMLREFGFRMPPLAGQSRIVDVMSSMDDVVQSTEQMVAVARDLRSGLLSDLLSGKHEIPEAYDCLLGAA